MLKLKTTQNSQSLHAVCTVEPVVPNFCRKSFNLFVFPVRFQYRMLETSFSNLLSEYLLYAYRFSIKILSSELTSVTFNM